MSFLSEIFAVFRKQIPIANAEYIVFGIGNVGSKYENTRHNIGFMVADHCLARVTQMQKSTVPFAQCTVGLFAGKYVAFVKPTTFVNKSGDAVGAALKVFGLHCDRCLVVVDDYNIPLGTMRFRRGGSDGGHNGLKSIIGEVGQDFPRLRIGIGPRPRDTNTIDFVLGTFTEQEEKSVARMFGKAALGIEMFMSGAVEKATAVFNSPNT